MAADGTWRVLRGRLRPKIAARLEKAGMLVGVYTSHVSFDRLHQDIEEHINELAR